MKRSFTGTEETERKAIKRYVAKIGTEEHVIKLCNMHDAAYTKEVLCNCDGIGQKSASRILALYRVPGNVGTVHCNTVDGDTDKENTPLAEYFSSRLLMFFDTYIDRDIEELRTRLIIVRKKCETNTEQQFFNDIRTLNNDVNYILNDIKDVVEEIHGVQRGKYAKKLRRQFAQQALKWLTKRKTKSKIIKYTELQPQFTHERLRAHPFEILKQYKFKFKEIDQLALENGWWELHSLTRAQAAIESCWTYLYTREKCTACSPTQLNNTCKTELHPAISDELFQEALDALIIDGKFHTYNSIHGKIVTSQQLLELETNIANFVRCKDDECCDRDHEHSFMYEYDTYEYNELGNFTTPQLHVFICDAETQCLPYKLTDEQRACILMILQEPFSMVNAPGGTGKTNAVFKLVVHIMQKLGYTIVTVTPTHAAKKPICIAMNCKPNAVNTIQSLTFNFGEGPKIRKLLKHMENGSDDDDDDDYEHSNDKLNSRKMRMFIVLDESSMYGSEDVGCLFGELFMHRKHWTTRTCMMGDTGQLTPVTPGVPFEDLVNSELFPLGVLTINHRSETKSISEFCNIFRGDCTNHWTFNDKNSSTNCKYVLDTSEVEHIETDKDFKDISAKYEHLLHELQSSGISQNDIMSITANNKDCLKLSHIVRRVFDPRAEQKRQEKVSELKDDSNKDAYDQGKWGMFADGDAVCFTQNCRWYKNGDETRVLANTYKKYTAYVKHTCNVQLEVDEEYNRLFWKIKNSKETSGDTFWLQIDNVPQGLTFLYEKHDEHRNVIGGVWSITMKAEDLKPLSCITAHKSQGDQKKYVIFIVPYAVGFRDCRAYYTPCSRTQTQLYLLGPTLAFDSIHAKRQNMLPITLLQSIFPSMKTLWAIDDMDVCDITEKLHLESVMKHYRKQIPQSLRRRIWERDCHKQIDGRCGCCGKCVRFDSPEWNLCHIVARAINEDLAFDEENLKVGCRTCNLKMHIKNLFSYKQELENNGLLVKTSTDLAQEFYHYVQQQNLKYLKGGKDHMRSEKTMIQDFQQFNPNAMASDLHAIIKAFVDLGKITRYSKPSIYNQTHSFYSLRCR